MSGISNLAEGMSNPEVMERADREVERLRNDLKEKVKSDIKDIGTLRREMSVTVPADVIQSHFDHNFNEIRTDVAIPGFRKGRAPKALVRKRFAPEVGESLKTSIVGQSFLSAVEQHKLEVLGDPLFKIEKDNQVKLLEMGEAFETIKLPEEGDFTYTCEFEIKPGFELPELKGVPVTEPKAEIAEETVQEFIDRQLKIRGQFQPLEGGAADKEDMLIADVVLKVGDEQVKSEANVQLGVRASRLDGIALMTLDEVLSGAKPGDDRTVECTFPEDYERVDLRGKAGRFEFKIHEVKRLVPITKEALMEQVGAGSEDELRTLVMHELEAERDRLVSQAKKQQVIDYLLEKTPMDVPEGLSARHTDRAVMRRVVELQQQGVPGSEIEAKIDELRTSAREQVMRDLKAEFILEKVAEKLGVGISEEEVNTEIARMARLYNQRFDRVRDDLHRRGLLPQLASQIRYDKCVQIILRDATVTQAQAAAEAPEAAPEKKKTPRKKKEQ